MNTIYDQFMALANRLEREGKEEDAALVYSAAFQTSTAKPLFETVNRVGDMLVVTRRY